jgi:hypothetical protein
MFRPNGSIAPAMTSPPSQTHAAGPALAAAALALALYAVTLGGTYIFDDVQIITVDKRIQSPQMWKQIWTRDYFNGGVDNLYRPLVTQSFRFQWWLHGNRPWAFHLVNLLLHAAAAAAVAELARRLAGIKAAYIAGLLFAAHPIHVEAVAEIVGRCDELCTLFVLSALAIFLRRPLTMTRAVSIGLCSIAAMLSKEQGLLLPFLLLALAWLTGRHAESKKEKLALQTLTLILCFSAAGLIILREQVLHLIFEWETAPLDLATQPLKASGPADRALMVFVILGRYAQLMIAPVKLSIDYGLGVMTSVADRRDPYLYAGFAAAAAWIAALLWALLRRQRPAAFCLIAAAMTYLMVSNVLLIGTIFGERLMYLPSAFLLIWLAMQLARLPRGDLTVLMLIVLALFGWRTVTYAARWNNRQHFYAAGLAEQPRSVRLCILVAADLMNSGDLAAAEQVAEQGERIAPQYWNIWYLAGQISEKQGDLIMADSLYKRAMKLWPTQTLQNRIRLLDAEIRNGR